MGLGINLHSLAFGASERCLLEAGLNAHGDHGRSSGLASYLTRRQPIETNFSHRFYCWGGGGGIWFIVIIC